ncbi:uncharacterized protein A1O5_03669 [Cladophialophora psammophila CBS 110553]|uniref:CFEM domain-containing protein n=1 Tax=Cladophialophora psammophila CBS 110553 TaxID=1182543 RepID=W9WX55_9EURO|nr:uncharacterized protein A1O5_03669 [Cladophialophora psammophila CBS 110553]EXJ72523.1 hypothetical protein A1O5_03669 [Cladophialophora psammophila CBS 110553]
MTAEMLTENKAANSYNLSPLDVHISNHAFIYPTASVSPHFIGCPSPWYNECVCGLDQQSAAGAQVSACMLSRCTDNVGISTAVEVYFDYCSSAGYALATTAATTLPPIDYSTVSLSGDRGFEVLRSCEQECIWGTCCISVADFIGCNSPWYNGCVCDLNMQNPAASHVASCISSKCASNTDVSTAVAVYLDYCASAGYPLANVARVSSVATQASRETLTFNVNGDTATTMTPPVTTAAGTTSSNGPSTTHAADTPASTNPASHSGYSTSDKIALGVGIGVGLPSLLATIWSCLRIERRALGLG